MNEGLPKFKGEILLAKIAEVSEGLTYISEIDGAFQTFDAGKRDAVAANYLFEKESRRGQVEEISFGDLFQRLTEQRDWFDEENKLKAKRFAELENLLQENLRDLKVFKVGRIQIDIYILGFDVDRNIIGIKTKAVET